MLSSMHVQVTDDKLLDLLTAVDLDKSGEMDFNEFVKVLSSCLSEACKHRHSSWTMCCSHTPCLHAFGGTECRRRGTDALWGGHRLGVSCAAVNRNFASATHP